MDESASFIPYGVSHLIDLPGFYSVGSAAVIEPDDFVFQLGNLHKVVEGGSTTEGFIDSRVEYLRGYGLRKAPPFSYPPEFSSGYFIPGVIVYAGCHVGITDFEHRHFGYGGVCCHEGEITEHNVSQLSMTKVVISPWVMSLAPPPSMITFLSPLSHNPMCFTG